MSDDDHTTNAAEPPSLEQAVEQLAATGTADLIDTDGAPLRVSLRAIRGTSLSGDAPRLRVAQDQVLMGRVVGPDRRPWLVELAVTSAEYHTDATARVELAATGVRADSSRRQTERSHIGGVAHLTAVHCRDIVDGDVIDGTVVDLAPGGVAIASRRVLRIGDRFEVTGRFFNETLSAEVRVRTVRDALTPGQNVYGCAFIHLGPTDAAKLAELLEDPGHGRAAVDLGDLRRLRNAAGDGDGGSGSWRSRLFGS